MSNDSGHRSTDRIDHPGHHGGRLDQTQKLIEGEKSRPQAKKEPVKPPQSTTPAIAPIQTETSVTDKSDASEQKTSRKLLLFLLSGILVLGIVAAILLLFVIPEPDKGHLLDPPPTQRVSGPISIDDAGLYRFNLKYLNRKTLKEIMENPESNPSITRLTAGGITLPNRRLTDEDDSLCLRVKASSDAALQGTLKGFLKWAGSQPIETQGYAFDPSNNLCLIDLRIYLSQLWQSNGNRWPNGDISLELYIDDSSVKTLTFTVSQGG